MAIEREGISVDISANAGDFVGGIGQAISSLTGFRAATAAAAGATAFAFGVQSVKSFAAYETAVENVRQVHGLTAEEIAESERRMREFRGTAEGATFSARELAGTMAAVAQGSRELGETEGIVEAAAALTATRRAGDSVAENAETLSALLEALGRNGEDARKVAEVLFDISEFSGISESDLAGDIENINSRARAFNVSLEEQAALIAVLRAQSADPRQLFTGLAGFDEKGGAQDKALAARFNGLSAFETDGTRKSLQTLAEDLNVVTKAAGITGTEAFARLSAVLGDKAANALLIYAGSLGEVALVQERMAQSTDDIGAAIEGHADTTASEWETLLSNIEDFKSRAGEGIAPWLNDWLGADSVGQVIQNWAERAGGGILDGMEQMGVWFGAGYVTHVAPVLDAIRSTVGTWAGGAGAWLTAIGSAIASAWNAIKPFFEAFKANVVAFLADITNTISGYTPPIPTVPHRSALGGMTISDPMNYGLPPASTWAAPTGNGGGSVHITNATINLPAVTDAKSFQRDLTEFTANYGTQTGRRGSV